MCENRSSLHLKSCIVTVCTELNEALILLIRFASYILHPPCLLSCHSCQYIVHFCTAGTLHTIKRWEDVDPKSQSYLRLYGLKHRGIHQGNLALRKKGEKENECGVIITVVSSFSSAELWDWFTGEDVLNENHASYNSPWWRTSDLSVHEGPSGFWYTWICANKLKCTPAQHR